MTWSGASAFVTVALLAAFPGRAVAAPVRAATCTKDKDCSAGSTCQSGKCVLKPASGSTSARSDSSSSGTASSGAASSGPAAANNARPSIVILGLYSYGGFGIGARVEYPVALNVLKEVPWRNDIFVVGGIEYYTQSYNYGFGNYRFNYVRIDAGAMWNFWFLENFAAYPKLTLGYDVAWLSGYNNAFGTTPSSGGIAFEGAVGVIYNVTPSIQLRGEIGSSSLKAGVGFHFL